LEDWKHTQPFLAQVDAFAERVLSGKTNAVEDHRMFRQFVFLDTFRDQFKQFLSSFELPSAVCEENERWHTFLEHYAGVVEDGSLACRAPTQRLKLVSEVIITKGAPAPPDAHIPFALSWEVILLDGKRMTVEVNAWVHAGGNATIVHGITLR